MINLIVAFAENRVIGNGDKIPWYIPEDFKLFKENTLNSVIIMGRKTWDSLPKKPLPNRENIVISRNVDSIVGDCIKTDSLKDAITKAKEFKKEVFVIGGSSIYKQALDEDLIDCLYLSHVKGEFEGDIFFPEINYSKWKVVEEKEFEKFIFKKYTKCSK